MDSFRPLFGIDKKEIKKTCILVPLLTKGMLDAFGVAKICRGKLYQAGQGDGFTLVVTGVGAGFVGDAVLYLKETGCEQVFLFGSCGLVKETKGLSIGSLVSVVKASAFEGFSRLLLGKEKQPDIFYPDQGLAGKLDLPQVHCATVS